MDKDNDILQNTIDDRIDAFIRGTMTEEEEAAFKQEIKANPQLRSQVLATVSLINHLIKTILVIQESLVISNEHLGLNLLDSLKHDADDNYKARTAE